MRGMHSTLASRIYTNGAQQSASGAVFPDAPSLIPNIGAKFLDFTSKSGEVWSNLPARGPRPRHGWAMGASWSPPECRWRNRITNRSCQPLRISVPPPGLLLAVHPGVPGHASRRRHTEAPPAAAAEAFRDAGEDPEAETQAKGDCILLCQGDRLIVPPLTLVRIPQPP